MNYKTVRLTDQGYESLKALQESGKFKSLSEALEFSAPYITIIATNRDMDLLRAQVLINLQSAMQQLDYAIKYLEKTP